MSPFLVAGVSGFLSCAVLIVAIGAQNMFVLRQGLTGTHALSVVLFCGCADTLLVATGVAGAGSFVAVLPGVSTVLTLGGAAFLAAYGTAALWRIVGSGVLPPATGPALSLGRTLGATAAFTFLNPHVYLDTVLLMGATGASHPSATRPLFVLGAAVASFGWFSLIGLGARSFAPLFAQPRTWRVIDAAVGCIMLGLAANLLRQAWPAL